MIPLLIREQDEAALRFIHASRFGELPSYREIGMQAGFSNGYQVDACLDRLIAAGFIRQLCQGELVGLFVRLPGEAGLGKRLTSWTGRSWRDLRTGSMARRVN